MATKKRKLLFVSLLLAGCSGGESVREMHNYPIYKDGIPFSKELWNTPDSYEVEEEDVSENIKGIYLRSDWNGKESYAFAYLGKPSIKKDSYPAVLLLHGGAGSAYYQWVEKWTEKGYVALAVDLEGHVPNKDATLQSMPFELYQASEYEAPHNSNLEDENEDVTRTWLYYACKTAIIANSYLHSLEGVDKNQIGVTGVSWGGFITSIITGYDDRFAFSLPIYCTIGMENSGSPIGEYITNHPSFRIFDSLKPLKEINTPFHLFVSNCDHFQNPHSASELIKGMKNAGLSIYDKFLHSQAEATYLEDPYIFADRILNKEKEISIEIKDNKVKISNLGKNNISFAEIYYSEDALPSTEALWEKNILDLDSSNEGEIHLETNTQTSCYVSILDVKGVTTSSQVLKL